MTRTTAAARPWYFWPLIAFFVGLFIGWIVIGWGVWPVQWTNALPSDLKSDLQYQYLTMVAESHAATGDLDTARQRLASYEEDELSATLVGLQEYLIDTDARRAGQVQGLIAALRLPSPQADATAPAPATTADAAAPQSSVFRTLLTAVIWAVLIIAALAALAWLFFRWTKAEGGLARELLGKIRLPQRASPTPGEIIDAEKHRAVGRDLAGGSVRRKSTPDAVTYRHPAEDETYTPLDMERAPHTVPPASVDMSPAAPVIEAWTTPPPAPAAPVVEPSRPHLPEAVDTSMRPAPPAASAALPTRIATYVAVYPDESDPNYYEVFDLKEGDAGPMQQEGLIGQCALAIHRPEGVNSGPAHAFELWLSDRRDSDYQVRLLMSEGAYRDTYLRSQYAGKADPQPIRLGAEFEMTTRNLILRARVEHLEYDEKQEPLHSVISELNVRLICYRQPT